MNESVTSASASQDVAPMIKPFGRVWSIDVFRGLVMFLMMAEVLELSRASELWPGNGFAAFLDHHQSHVAWVGCSLHDLIQPSFSFLVGTAMLFSLQRRRAEGESTRQTWLHAVWRGVVLIFMGVFLRSVGAGKTNFTFEDTLSQIGLGYVFLHFIAQWNWKRQIASCVVILLGYWAAFALYQAPGANFDYAAAGVAADWAHHKSGFESHWNLNSNAASAFDIWFLNLFPREQPFAFNEGGYSTLSFIPTLGTMILGLLAGQMLWRGGEKKLGLVVKLLLAGAVCIGLGIGWHLSGTCPLIKKIWTPSWTLFSGGCCFVLLAAFHALLDLRRKEGQEKAPSWALPLRVIGANSIVAYFIAHLWPGFIKSTLHTHFGFLVNKLPDNWKPLTEGVVVFAVLYWGLYAMWRKKWFVRV